MQIVIATLTQGTKQGTKSSKDDAEGATGFHTSLAVPLHNLTALWAWCSMIVQG
jgi:hypothetical protein